MADVNVAEEKSVLETLEEQARSLGIGPSEWYELRQQPLDNIFTVLAMGGQSEQAARAARVVREARMATAARTARTARANHVWSFRLVSQGRNLHDGHNRVQEPWVRHVDEKYLRPC